MIEKKKRKEVKRTDERRSQGKKRGQKMNETADYRCKLGGDGRSL
jgi:hypothetical protein